VPCLLFLKIAGPGAPLTVLAPQPRTGEILYGPGRRQRPPVSRSSSTATEERVFPEDRDRTYRRRQVYPEERVYHEDRVYPPTGPGPLPFGAPGYPPGFVPSFVPAMPLEQRVLYRCQGLLSTLFTLPLEHLVS
jgi:hypothetical protein